MAESEEKLDILYGSSPTVENAQVPFALSRSEGERLSVEARKKKVLEALQKLGINAAKDNEPPIIAVLGSGGGLRAMIAFLGTLAELANEDILDLITYVCGTSGSTWCISSLYNNDKWSSCMADMESQISERLAKPTWTWSTTWDKLKQTCSKDIASLTDFWAYAVVHKIINELNENKLSDHQAACESGDNPYPVYSAVEKGHLQTNQPGAWFEFTPHLAGFPAYRSFVKTELLGSQFQNGKLLKSQPEMDLCYLQGLWGSAPASDDFITQATNTLIQKLFPSGIHSFTDEVVTQEDYFIFDIKDFSNPDFGGSCKKCDVISNIVKSIVNWKWGITNNFLYKLKSNVPDDLSSKEHISLVDAGLDINSAYPLMLPPNRKVDLILSFDFSEGDPFLTLENTAEYCKTNGTSFPKVEIEGTEKKSPSKSCYIFEGDGMGTPDVMHFPLFNNQNCGDKVKDWRKNYATFKLSYNESELKDLLQVSKINVTTNKEQILQKIQYIINCP